MFDKGKHPRSQDLKPVQALKFAITIWNCKLFKEQYERVGHGVYTGRLGFFETEGYASVHIDYEADFAFAELVARFIAQNVSPSARYPDYVENYLLAHDDIKN